ncbi:MAG: hypothetical protein SLAVMIC_00099 [uncultured marine phage]|uniref:Uncharacterized protein n=1 Tax=uncultured marine phage TaxID=707152 RepID=A0A8D9CB09_9VIRU|nr:MAG: hypothetical protein SLAVMIC_00099 [uncultured marine phage]
MGKSIKDYIKIRCNGTVSDDVTKLNIKHYRFYMPVYKYNGEYYVDNIPANTPIGIREYLVDLYICSEIISLKKIFREDRLKKLLD